MCLSKVYLDKGEKEELLMEEITLLKTEGEKLLFKTLFGEEREIEATIKQIDFTTHTIFLENRKQGDRRRGQHDPF
ncbi:MAG: RNA-binding protein [Chloroflexi bacterium]|nr:MAG: RNA-binding protein [Chloroflexota bacterium]